MGEYDLPVMNEYFSNQALSELNEKAIVGFFAALKECSSTIHFTFIFGATRIIMIGGRFNILEDLTHNEEYSDMIGFGTVLHTYTYLCILISNIGFYPIPILSTFYSI